MCRACGRTFPVQGRKTYCDDACRQRGFRLRRRPSDEIGLGLATRLPKTAIVYQCPECEAPIRATSAPTLRKLATALETPPPSLVHGQ